MTVTTAPIEATKVQQPTVDTKGKAVAIDDNDDKTAIDPLSGRPYSEVYGFRPKTTWHLKPAMERNLWEFIPSLDLGPDNMYQKRSSKAPMRGPPPHRSILQENIFITTTSLIPEVLHFAWNKAFPEHKMHWAPAWLMYHVLFIVYAFAALKRLHKFIAQYGTLDEANRGRDLVPDNDVSHLGKAVFFYTILRTVYPFIVSWRGEMTNPFDGLSWATPIKIGLWQVTLDYFFYLYHRSTHTWDFLWWIHRKHHATKHPTPILSILADDVQESIEVFFVPLLATVFAPKMNFIEFHLTVCYTFYVEMLGHSGVRAEWQHPVLGWILKPLGMELAVEDHDLHHRYGKSGKNYGKQTRVWDKIFGTVGERIETPL